MRSMGRVRGIFPKPRYGGTSPLTPALLSVCRRARKGRGRSILRLAKRRQAGAARGVVRFVMRRENPRHPTRPHAALRRAGESEAGLADDADGHEKAASRVAGGLPSGFEIGS